MSQIRSDEDAEEVEDDPVLQEDQFKVRKNKRKSENPQKAHNGSSKQLLVDKSTSDIDETDLIEKDKIKKEDCEFLLIDDEKTKECQSKNLIKCNMCEKVFNYKLQFDVHYKSSYNQNPVYTCSICNKTKENYSTFRSHFYRHITESRFKCEQCPKAFALKSLLLEHISSKHTKIKPFKCDQCEKFFVTKAGWKIHNKKHKNLGVQEDYPCAECGKVLHSRGGLTSHMNAHRLGRRFMCDFCGKTFAQKVNMLHHVKQHTGDKPFKCDKCDKSFSEKSQLSRHFSFHNETRPFKCDVCAKKYKTERCLKVHSLVHSTERPYNCTICSKGFLSNNKLKQHLNIHTGERPYACKYCERKFTNYPNWLKHTRRRHKVDHKTGESLVGKSPVKSASCDSTNIKLEDLNSDSIQSDFFTNLGVSVDPIPHEDNLTSDIMLSKTEELFLKQSIKDFPSLENGSLKFLEATTSKMNEAPQLILDELTGNSGDFFISDVPDNLVTNSLVQNGQFDYVPLQFS